MPPCCPAGLTFVAGAGHSYDDPMTEDFKVHIYPSDCDSVGHGNHAHMLTLLERARWSALERLAGIVGKAA